MKKIVSSIGGGIILLCIFSGIYAPAYNIKHTVKQQNIPKAIVVTQPAIAPQNNLAWNEMKELVKHYEGFYAKPYSCPAGFKTIGYGFTDKKLVRRSAINKKESSAILENKLRKIETQVDEIVDVELTPYQKCALVSFTYNCDVDNLEKLVSGPGRLNDGNYSSVKYLLIQYTKGGGKTLKGLVARRHSEVRLWEKG
jgi:lysozyme